ncbi:MAG: Uma2 family endonuclease [Nostoc sp.]|uniref:Uma2 family endonuclease n=1 Tax=Nostoc sp. TaxID=1180 RepID=UPI002FF7FE52
MAASVEHGLNNNASIPPLESGDRLTRHEFERRYTAMPNKKAELIEGVVYVASPLRFRSHGQPHGQLITWLGVYQACTPGLALGDNATVRLDLDNEPQPDVVLLIDKPARGQAQISKDDYVEGAPELVAEVAASSASIDLYDKKRAYRRNGVQEYIVWQTLENKLDWFYLQNGEYLPFVADADGVIKSRVFPGLWLDVTSIITGDMTKVLAVLQQGLNSQEHVEFVECLAEKY